MPKPKKSQPEDSKTAPKSAEKKGEGSARPVVYDKPEVRIVDLTATEAKQLVGWEDEGDGIKFGDGYVKDIKPIFGRKVRLTNNVTNRPIYSSNVMKLCQEILRRRWFLNLENRIIGRTGLVLNGQHTFLALILADELHSRHPEDYPAWPKDQHPTIQTSIGFGADESDEAVNTMDTCLPRSLADVIYRSPYFQGMQGNERKMAARMTDYAVKLLWHRTGRQNAFGIRRTHAEALDFLAKHPRVLECVRHISEENADGKIARFLSPGNAAGLMYLMAVGKTDPKTYRAAQDPTEEMLDFSQWDKAQEFWVLLAGDDEAFKPIKHALGKILEDNGSVSNGEKWGIVVNAWNCFLSGEKITASALKLSYYVDDDGVSHLDEEDCPTCGGIDLGNAKKDDGEEFITTIPDDEPTEEEVLAVEQRKQAAIEAKQRGESSKAPKAPKVKFVPKKAGKEWAKDDVAWVRSEDGDHYMARLVDEPYKVEGSDPRVMVNDGGAEWEVLIKDLSLEEPKAKAPRIVPRPMTPAEKKAPKNPSNKKPGDPKVGGLVWVKEASGDHWRGRLVEQVGKSCKIKVEQGFRGAGNIRPVHANQISTVQPSPKTH